MADSQSRYSIIEQLNQKKIDVKHKLSEKETEATQVEMNYNKNQDKIKRDVKVKEENYELDHKNWVREQEVKVKLIQSQHDRDIKKCTDDINDAKATYKQNFKDWKDKELKQHEANEVAYKNYEKLKNMESAALEDEVAEIKVAIQDLKDVSSEQKKEKE